LGRYDDFNPEAVALYGTVANGSSITVTGKVRIVEVNYGDSERMEASINEMVDGEILIAEFTAPELLIACRKAKAIVTDIGGLLSHAAIVSRELNLPCLVGTKHASKLFKTGDFVKVDFNLGVISKF
jgi:phosphohistidine swiveling domain-containing protein